MPDAGSESFSPAAPVILARRERADQGSVEVTGWCPACRERAVPMKDGTCGFCETKLQTIVPAAVGEVVPAAVGEVVDERLEQLARTIAREQQFVVRAGAAMVEHAILCGEALIEAKGRVTAGEWETWLAHTFPDRSLKTWRLYMRLARHKDQVLAVSPANLNDAHQLLAGEPMLPYDESIKVQAREMRKSGDTYTEIADELDVSVDIVSMWCDPEKAERRRKRNGNLSRRAQRAALVGDHDRLLAEVGGDLGLSYGRIREAEETLRGLVDEGADGPVRLAVTKLLQAEDLLVKAARSATPTSEEHR